MRPVFLPPKEARLHQFPISLPKPEELRIQIQTGRMQCTSAMQQCRHRISCLPTLLFHVRSFSLYLACYPSSHLHPLCFMRYTKVKCHSTSRYCYSLFYSIWTFLYLPGCHYNRGQLFSLILFAYLPTAALPSPLPLSLLLRG